MQSFRFHFHLKQLFNAFCAFQVNKALENFSPQNTTQSLSQIAVDKSRLWTESIGLLFESWAKAFLSCSFRSIQIPTVESVNLVCTDQCLSFFRPVLTNFNEPILYFSFVEIIWKIYKKQQQQNLNTSNRKDERERSDRRIASFKLKWANRFSPISWPAQNLTSHVSFQFRKNFICRQLTFDP